jgi:hypothetical protein
MRSSKLMEPDSDDQPGRLPGRPGIMSGRRKTSDFDADDAAFAKPMMTQVPGRLPASNKNFLKRPKKKIGDALGVAAKGAPPFAKKGTRPIVDNNPDRDFRGINKRTGEKDHGPDSGPGLRHPSLPPGHPFNKRRR